MDEGDWDNLGLRILYDRIIAIILNYYLFDAFCSWK